MYKHSKDIVDAVIKITDADESVREVAIETVNRCTADAFGKDTHARVGLGLLLIYALECIAKKHNITPEL